jgi:hypothetical protein
MLLKIVEDFRDEVRVEAPEKAEEAKLVDLPLELLGGVGGGAGGGASIA